MDPFTQKMLERTRLRRENLAKKMSETSPPAHQRKRSSPLKDITTKSNSAEEFMDGCTPIKKPCLRTTEQNIKPDTPAISSVSARIQNINSLTDVLDYDPSPNTVARKGRLAALAKDINSWENDTSHHSLKLQEDMLSAKSPKRTWKLPSPLHCPISEDERYGSCSPQKSLWKSPSKSPMPPKSPSRIKLDSKSPLKSVIFASHSPNRSPKPFSKGPVSHSPVKSVSFDPNRGSPTKSPFSTSPGRPILRNHSPAKGLNSEDIDDSDIIPQKPPRTYAYRKAPQPPNRERSLSPEKKDSDSPLFVSNLTLNFKKQNSRRESFEPTNQAVSVRKGMWEKRTQENPQPITPGRKTPTKSPAKIDFKNDEITEQPVSARMAAWRDKINTTPQTSFKDAIADRARLIQERSGGQNAETPIRRPGVSMGSHTKTMQNRILKQFSDQDNEMSERIKIDREAEMSVVRNRWAHGIIKTDDKKCVDESSSDEDDYQSTVVERLPRGKREQHRQKIRGDFENKLNAMGFEVKSSSSNIKRQSNVHTRHKSGYNPSLAKTYQPVSPKTRHQSDSTEMHQTEITPVMKKMQTLDSLKQQRSEIVRSKDEINRRISAGEKDVKHSYKTSKQQENENIFDTVVDNKDYNSSSGQVKRYSSEHLDVSIMKKRNVDSSSDEEKYDATKSSSTHTVYNDNVNCETTVTVDSDKHARRITIERKINMNDDNMVASNKQIVDNAAESDITDDEVCGVVKCDVNGWALSDTNADDTLSQDSTSVDDFHLTRSDSIWKALETKFENYRTTSQSTFSSYDTEKSDNIGKNEGGSQYDGDESTGNDEFLAEMDDLLDEDEEDDDDVNTDCPGRKTAQRSNSRNLKQKVSGPCAEKSIEYSIDMYRTNRNSKNKPAPKITVVRRDEHGVVQDGHDELPFIPDTNIKERIQELEKCVKIEQSIIIDTTNTLLNSAKCRGKNSSFAGSEEQVECNKVLLIACQKRQAYIEEVERLKHGPPTPRNNGCTGSLTISEIKLPLKADFVSHINQATGLSFDNAVHYFIVLVRHGPHVITTQMISTRGARAGLLDFSNLIQVNEVKSDFKLQFEVYSMSITKEAQEKPKKSFTPKKLLSKVKGQKDVSHDAGTRAAMAVKTTNFSLVSTIYITLKSLHNRTFNLPRVPMNSPLQGYVHMKLRCCLRSNVEERGFLTMFEDVSGFGAWHRRWCVLASNQLKYWRYPDDEYKKEPMGTIELKNCVTDVIGLIPRDICARPNTFELVIIRPQSSGDKNTLVTWKYDTTTATKHMLSADTKDERILWCYKFNKALENIRTWQSDALRPLKQGKRAL